MDLPAYTACCASAISYGDPKLSTALADPQGQKVHASVVESLVRNSANMLPRPMGASERDWRRATRKRMGALKDAVKNDMEAQWKVYLGIGAGIFVFITGGLGALVLLIVEAALAWYIEEW